MNKISLQVIITVILLVSIFAVTTAGISAYNSYYNLAELARSRTSALAADFASDFDDYMDNLQIVIGSIENDQQFTEALQNLTTYGPLYSLENIQQKPAIADAERIYYLRSQLQMSRILINWIALHNVNEIILYQKDTFNQTGINTPVPSMRITTSDIYFYSYRHKGDAHDVEIYHTTHDILNSSENIFDVSSVYQNPFSYYSKRLNLHKTDAPVSKTFDLSDINAQGHYLGQRLYTENDMLFAVIWNSLQIKMTNPENWEDILTSPAMLLIKYNPESLFYHQYSAKEKVERGIGSSTRLFYADNDQHIQKPIRQEGDNLWIGEESFITSKEKLSLSKEDKGKFFVYTFLPKTQLLTSVKSLLSIILVITLLSILVMAVILYLLVSRQLTTPLHMLIDSINHVRSGDLSQKTLVNTNNEFSTLANAFNEMTQALQDKNNALEEYQNTLEQKVTERTAELETAQMQLVTAEKMASLGQLVAGIAHEVNTPLGNCITSLSFVESAHKKIREAFDNKQLTSNDFKEFIDTIAEAGSIMEKNLLKASELIKTFKKVAVNQSIEEITHFNLQEHISEVLVTLHPTLRKHQVQVSKNIAADINLHSYPGALYQVISNILLNAIRHAFSTSPGSINITAQQKGQQIILTFEDNGCGMPAEILQRIFDPFFTTKRGEGGTGLGLYMTYNIITQQLGGSINCESQEGKGSRFIIMLPIEAPLADANAKLRF